MQDVREPGLECEAVCKHQLPSSFLRRMLQKWIIEMSDVPLDEQARRNQRKAQKLYGCTQVQMPWLLEWIYLWLVT